MVHQILKKLEPYNVILQFAEGNPVVSLQLPPKWLIQKNNIIKSAKHPHNKNTTLFFSEDKKSSFDDIINMVSQIIIYNLEQEQKEKLFKEKTKELVGFFTENTLGDLESLEFTIGGTNQHFGQTISPNELIVKEIVPQPKIEVGPKVVDEVQPKIEDEPIPNLREKAKENIKKKNITIPEDILVQTECTCGPDDICPICASSKGF